MKKVQPKVINGIDMMLESVTSTIYEDSVRPQNNTIEPEQEGYRPSRDSILRSLSDSLTKAAAVPILDLQNDLHFCTPIGEGAFGVVELHTMLDKECNHIQVAVKKLKATREVYSHDIFENVGVKVVKRTRAEVDAFVREIRLQSQIRHPNIVSVLGMGTYYSQSYGGDLPFMVQERMYGTLSALLGTEYSMKTGLTWCLDIARAIEYMHASQPTLIHRDLKPDNVLISHDNVAKVGDLGLFAAIHHEQRRKSFEESIKNGKVMAASRLSKEFMNASRLSNDSTSTKRLSNELWRTKTTSNHSMSTKEMSDENNSTKIEPVDFIGTKKASNEFTGVKNVSNDFNNTKKEFLRFTSGSYEDSSSSKVVGLQHKELSFLTKKLQMPFGKVFPTGKTGTFTYMAPENYRGEMYSEKVDQYSFGMLMYAILDHGDPHSKQTRYLPEQIADSAAKLGGIRPEIRSYWPNSVKQLIQECWDFYPENRPTFKHIVFRIKHILASEHDLLSNTQTAFVKACSKACVVQ